MSSHSILFFEPSIDRTAQTVVQLDSTTIHVVLKFLRVDSTHARRVIRFAGGVKPEAVIRSMFLGLCVGIEVGRLFAEVSVNRLPGVKVPTAYCEFHGVNIYYHLRLPQHMHYQSIELNIKYSIPRQNPTSPHALSLLFLGSSIDYDH